MAALSPSLLFSTVSTPRSCAQVSSTPMVHPDAQRSGAYLSYLQALQDVVLVLSPQHELTFINMPADSWFSHHAPLFWTPLPQPEPALCDRQGHPLHEALLPLRRVLAGESLHGLELQVLATDPAAPRWLSVNGSMLPDGHALVTLRDISQLKHDEADAVRLALYDPLTALPNRNLLMERVTQTLAHPPATEMALLLIDINRFKVINEHLGHAAGNQLLQDLSQRLQHVLAPQDTLARLGSDEFAVLLHHVDTRAIAIALVKRLQQIVAEPYWHQQEEICLDASIGIAFGPQGYRYPEDWLQDADTAVTLAKEAPLEGWCVFDSALKAQHDERLTLEIALRYAIAHDELRLHYQPIVAIHTQDVIGFEVLVRWQHPERGLLYPDAFIGMAEETGLVVPLGWWVLREACRQMQAWAEEMPATAALKVSVNMSSRQFAQRDLAHNIQTLLADIGFPPSRLTLEITESVLIDHSESIVATLKQLQAMGIQLSIDDFGTGYSSLSYLHRFPFDTLKIDRSFIENADQDFEKLEILQSVVRLAWNLGLEVVAEGVETQKHYAQLKALRCESGQGYLFSKPLPSTAAAQLLQQQFPPKA